MGEIRACKQIGCPVRETGECLEGIDLNKDTCTHFYWENNDDEDNTESEDEPAIPPVASFRTNLFPGTELQLQQVTMVTHKYPCDLIVILGDLDCGKTTLLATIFDLFQVGEFKDYMFAGSLTQKGFEIRSHLARVSSGSAKAETERTKTLEFRLLHIAIKSLSINMVKHLLLSDVSGETIRQARSSATIMKEQLSIAKQADHLFYIIDGEKLLVAERVKTMMNFDLFFQNAINNGIFDRSTKINILISKWDKLKDQKGFDLQSMVKDKITGRFGEVLGSIKYSVMASRPGDQSTDFDLGYGVEDFLQIFFQPEQKINPIYTNETQSIRMIDNFKMNGNGR